MRSITRRRAAEVRRAASARATSSRQLVSSAARSMPRSPSSWPRAGPSHAPPVLPERAQKHSSLSAADNDDAPPAVPTAPDLPDPSDPSSFPAVVKTLKRFPLGPLAPEHRPLYNTLATSFLPANQPTEPLDGSGDAQSSASDGRRGSASKAARSRSASPTATRPEPVVALVCPFEGGDVYVSRAVEAVAAHTGAEVLRIDLPLGVGLDGLAAPLSDTGVTAPPIPPTTNPLFKIPSPASPSSPEPAPTMEDDGDEDMEHGAIRLPIMAMGPGVQIMGGPPPMPGPFVTNDKWVAFFARHLESQLPDTPSPAPRRIILLDAAAAMSETFSAWWPSLVEAVRQRRRGAAVKGKKGDALSQPTTIILSCAPSLLLPHTGEFIGSNAENTSPENAIRSTIENALSEKFGGLGITVMSSTKPHGSDEKLWWASEEGDVEGRQTRDNRRLRALVEDGPTALLPAFETRGGSSKPVSMPGHPMLEALMSRMSKPPSAQPDNTLVWRTLAILPKDRDTNVEHNERVFRRRTASVALLSRAIHDLGGILIDPLAILRHDSAPTRGRQAGARRRRLDTIRAMLQDWDDFVIPWPEAQSLASMTLGRLLGSGDHSAAEPVAVRWQDVVDARVDEEHHHRQLDDYAKQHLPPLPGQTPEQAQPAGVASDPVIESLKKAKNLSNHEKRLIGCIVEPAKLGSTSFDDVHLPESTIDAVRTLVSLPLLHPEAFQGGILKDHQTQGMLMFGPPGTGKTLLARAVAKESGARMLAIQPSDVNDMYVGEGEKLVKAVFSLARKMSPCVIFLDEVDALLGARSARDSSGGAKAHNQVLTEFMQEMDGLSSAISNRDKRIMVIGATNRPFDLDDAILRRLPRRLLVDLPREEDRLAILKILLRDEVLGPDVKLEQIAKETEGYSGSDLKPAALASVKESLHLPWTKPATVAIIDKPSAAPAAPRPGSAREVEELVVPSEVAPQHHEPATTEPIPEPVTSVAGHAGADTLMRPVVMQTQADGHSDIGHASASPAPSSDVSTTAAPSSASSQRDSDPAPSQPRVVLNKHFQKALSDIRPSASEEGTLPELRKFGEGGKRRGTKSGFGKGFGFGDDVAKSRDAGYGRVTQEE